MARFVVTRGGEGLDPLKEGFRFGLPIPDPSRRDTRLGHRGVYLALNFQLPRWRGIQQDVPTKKILAIQTVGDCDIVVL